MRIAGSLSAGTSVESSLDSFIARTHAALLEMDDWGLAAAGKPAHGQAAEAQPAAADSSALLPAAGSAKVEELRAAAAAANGEEPHRRSSPWLAAITAFAAGLVVMFGITRVMGDASGDDSQAVVAKTAATPAAMGPVATGTPAAPERSAPSEAQAAPERSAPSEAQAAPAARRPATGQPEGAGESRAQPARTPAKATMPTTTNNTHSASADNAVASSKSARSAHASAGSAAGEPTITEPGATEPTITEPSAISKEHAPPHPPNSAAAEKTMGIVDPFAS